MLQMAKQDFKILFLIFLVITMATNNLYGQESIFSSNLDSRINTTTTTLPISLTAHGGETIMKSSATDGACSRICLISVATCGLGAIVICLVATLYYAICKDKEKDLHKETMKWRKYFANRKRDRRIQNKSSDLQLTQDRTNCQLTPVSFIQHPSVVTNKHRRSFDSSDTGSSLGYFSDDYRSLYIPDTGLNRAEPGFHSVESGFYSNAHLNNYSPKESLNYMQDLYSPYYFYDDVPSSSNKSKQTLKSCSNNQQTDVLYDVNNGSTSALFYIPQAPSNIRKSVSLKNLYDTNMYTIHEKPDYVTKNTGSHNASTAIPRSYSYPSYIQNANHYDEKLPELSRQASGSKRSVRFVDESENAENKYVEPGEDRSRINSIKNEFGKHSIFFQDTRRNTATDASLYDISEELNFEDTKYSFIQNTDRKNASMPTYMM